MDHFASSRKITVNPAEGVEPRKRDDDEKAQILAEFEEAQTAESESFAQIGAERDAMKETRPTEREEAFKDMDEERGAYKDTMQKLVSEERHQYREMIDGRTEKQGILLELIRQDKADVNALKSAIEGAENA